MTLEEVMNQQVYAVAGDTLNPDKFAAKIKSGLLAAGYTAYGVGKELSSFNDIPEDVDILDLCIRADRGLALLQENQKPFKCVVIQPGAESPELLQWLDEQKIPYLQNCLLIGMQQYPRAK